MILLGQATQNLLSEKIENVFIQYDEAGDVLHLQFSNSRLLRNRSKDPLIEAWFDADDRLVEVTVHAAKALKHWPIEVVLVTSAKPDTDSTLA